MIRVWALLLLFVPASVGDSMAESGRIAGLADSPSERVSPPIMIAPGEPPILSFRYFDGSDRSRFANLGLMTDDAGH